MIADNRIAELAEPDRTMLRELAEQLDDGAFDMDLTGFNQAALEELMTATMPAPDPQSDPTLASEHLVEIYCSKIALDAMSPQISDIQKIDGCTVNIS